MTPRAAFVMNEVYVNIWTSTPLRHRGVGVRTIDVVFIHC
jgi:hypothetical protein